jgi:hypothetical protein
MLSRSFFLTGLFVIVAALGGSELFLESQARELLTMASPIPSAFWKRAENKEGSNFFDWCEQEWPGRKTICVRTNLLALPFDRQVDVLYEDSLLSLRVKQNYR